MPNDNNEFVKSIENATLKIILEATKNMEKACLVVERDAKKKLSCRSWYFKSIYST